MKEAKGFACFGLVLFAIAAIVISAIMNGWALSVTWAWFIVPVFGLPTLTVVQAIGVALVAAILTHQSQESNKEKEIPELTGEIISRSVLVPLATVGLGWIIHSFM